MWKILNSALALRLQDMVTRSFISRRKENKTVRTTGGNHAIHRVHVTIDLSIFSRVAVKQTTDHGSKRVQGDFHVCVAGE